MNWQWLVDQGLISGKANYYASGQAGPAEYSNAVKVAYQNANATQRRQLIDMLWSTGVFDGSKEYWYQDRTSEIGSLASAASKLSGNNALVAEADGQQTKFGLAGGAELWKDTTTGESYVVYVVPGTENDPVYMRWTVQSEADVQSFFGPGQPIVYQQQYAGDDPVWGESIDFGSSDDIANTADSPFDSWSSTLEVEAASQPWLLDDDYQKLLAMSIVEGRELTVAEIQTTQWWQQNTASKRAWMQLFNGDPSEAKRRINDNQIAQAEYMRAAGMSDLDSKLVNFISDKVTMGDWSVRDMQEQVRILSDPYFSGSPLNGDLQNYIDDNAISSDLNNDRETEVRNLVGQWLGTNFGNWDDGTVSSWASRLRNEPDATEALIETLKDQKQTLFPEYDREADYGTISAPWKNMMRNVWGEVPADSDNSLQSIIRMNDATEASRYLTREGLQRGNQMVTNSVQSALLNSFGGTPVG